MYNTSPIHYPHASTSSYFQLKGAAAPFMACLSNDLLRSPVCYVNFVHPQHWQGMPFEFSIAQRIFILRSLTPADSV